MSFDVRWGVLPLHQCVPDRDQKKRLGIFAAFFKNLWKKDKPGCGSDTCGWREWVHASLENPWGQRCQVNYINNVLAPVQRSYREHHRGCLVTRNFVSTASEIISQFLVTCGQALGGLQKNGDTFYNRTCTVPKLFDWLPSHIHHMRPLDCQKLY